jgi:hypothetical protein
MFLRTLAALLFILSASPAVAQTDEGLPGPRECLDDDHTNRCDPEVQSRVRNLLGVASIEDEAASGAIVYRAFFVNGYGRDMPAVSFERRPGQSPEVVIYGFDGRTTRAPVTHEAWEQVVDQARIADRVLEPLPPRADGAISICAHAWVQTVEIANVPRERFGDETVRRRTESACGGGLATRFAFWLADLAVEQIPWCRLIDEDSERNGVTRAATCLILAGDRLAAVELYNARLADIDWRDLSNLDPNALRGRLMGVRGDVSLTWDSEILRTESFSDRRLADFLLARFADHPYLRFWPTHVEGVDTRTVHVGGVAEATTPEDVRITADYTQTWIWDPYGLQWALSEWTVDAFEPVHPPE